MIGTEATLLFDLMQEPEHSVLDALPRLKRVTAANGEDRAGFAIAFAVSLDNSTLHQRERHLRLQRVVKMLHLERSGLEQLAYSAQQLSPGMQSAIVGLLPPDLRPVAYRTDGHQSALDTESGRLKITEQESVSISHFSISAVETEALGEPFPNVTVLLLTAIEQEANRRLLNGAGFQVVNVRTVQEVEQWLTGPADICAFVIDRSFLSALSVAEQRDLVLKLASYSTFAWIRLDGSGPELQLDDATVSSIARDCRCRLTEFCNHELQVGTVSNLHERDLAHVRQAAQLLSHPAEGLVHLRNLDSLTLQVLVAVAATYAEERFQDRSGRVARIDVTLLHGGRSSDKVCVVRINQRGKPVLAKIGSMHSVGEEAKRFRHFLQDTYDYAPQLHFHRGTALLVYQLYSEDFEDFEPAPTLETCLRNLWLNAIGFQSEGLLLSELEFDAVISHAIRRLSSLNRTTPRPSEFCTIFPSVLRPIFRLEKAGVDWGFDPWILNARTKAFETAHSLNSAATVHGDVQFRNILVTSRADCALIDFPGVGPGHPASDLTRMELHFFSNSLMQMFDYSELVRFQNALSHDMYSLNQLLASFPTLSGCDFNRVCIRGIVYARDAAVCAVNAFDGSHRDYLAAKLLTAWQMLTMEGLNHGATRAVITAISPAFI